MAPRCTSARRSSWRDVPSGEDRFGTVRARFAPRWVRFDQSWARAGPNCVCCSTRCGLTSVHNGLALTTTWPRFRQSLAQRISAKLDQVGDRFDKTSFQSGGGALGNIGKTRPHWG